jgi:SPP1 gp7 family putative phage head morphogenesis protein
MPLERSALVSKPIVGGGLISSAAIADDYAKPILTLFRRMAEETQRELRRMFDDPGYALDAVDGNPASRARIILNRLSEKYEPLFRKWAKKATDRMLARNLRHAESQINESLKDASQFFEIKSDLMSDRLREITVAASNEAAGLIKMIPQQYLQEVGGAVARSVSTGNGMQDLVPFLDAKYGQNIRHARLVAHDQTRKAFTNISTARLKAAGVKKFEWRHSHGGRTPRKLHEELNGKVFSYDDPPYIGDMYGQKVYGLPSTLPNCRCFPKPIIDFGDEE